MTDINELAVRLAKEVEMTQVAATFPNMMTRPEQLTELVRLAVKEGMERAAKVCEREGRENNLDSFVMIDISDAIRAEAEKL